MVGLGRGGSPDCGKEEGGMFGWMTEISMKDLIWFVFSFKH